MTDQDRKDHELAAKAAGYVLTFKHGGCKGGAYCGAFIERGGEVVAWRPKEDNGDAFALMVDCRISPQHWKMGVESFNADIPMQPIVHVGGDRHEAARLSIFNAAVALGGL
jgi:hypothetical protein